MADNRESLRYHVMLKCNVRSDVDLKYTEMFMSNLSRGGCFINSDFFIPEGTDMELALELPELSREFMVRGRVVWNRKVGSEYKGYGVQFLSIDTESLTALKKYIEQMVLEDVNRFFL